LILKGKNIVITGAGRGIGRQIAITAIQDGANVALVARTASELQDTTRLLLTSTTHRCYSLDIADVSAVEKTFQKIARDFGTIDGLVNNAGTQPPIGPFHQVVVADWIRNLEVNLIGTIACTHAVLPLMIAARKGKIVNFSGGGSTSPRPNFSAYGVAKTAIVRFTETIAEELQVHGIDVNAISPGAVNTKMLDEVLQKEEAVGSEYAEALRRKETGGSDPRLAADLVCFLLSHDSDGITGKLISAVWDHWQEEEFRALLRSDKDIAVLRRIDKKTFFKKS
jgi:3-oxoacyl-[acyl-carrier protein] reductase